MSTNPGKESKRIKLKDEVDNTIVTSKQGEVIPVTNWKDVEKSWKEYLPWLKGQILSVLDKRDYRGINPSAQSLGDDINAWVYRSQEFLDTSLQEALTFTKEVFTTVATHLQEDFEPKVFLTSSILRRIISDLENKIAQE